VLQPLLAVTAELGLFSRVFTGGSGHAGNPEGTGRKHCVRCTGAKEIAGRTPLTAAPPASSHLPRLGFGFEGLDRSVKFATAVCPSTAVL
jgi:hypothetical protein